MITKTNVYSQHAHTWANNVLSDSIPMIDRAIIYLLLSILEELQNQHKETVYLSSEDELD